MRLRQHPLPLRPKYACRQGFTLIELVLVVLVMLILMTLTVAVVGNMLDSDRVRGASRQVKNYLAGARDRAIYSASRVEVGSGETPPRVGVRFLVDPSLIDPATNQHRGFTSMVFVQENRPIDGFFRIFEDPVGSGNWFVSQFMPDDTPIPDNEAIQIQSLIDRGLVEPRTEYDSSGTPQDIYYLPLTFPTKDTSLKKFYVRFLPTLPHVRSGYLFNAPLSAPPPGDSPDANVPEKVTVHLLPSPLPGEEPRLLPQGTIVEIQSSVVGNGPQYSNPLAMNVSLQNLSRADGSFDIMFNAQGVVDGPIAAAGLVHLVIADLQDIERGFRLVYPNSTTGLLEVGSPYSFQNGDMSQPPLDEDGDGKPDERQGDVRIVSIRTQTGGASIAQIDPTLNTTDTNRFDEPFRFAEEGEEAR